MNILKYINQYLTPLSKKSNKNIFKNILIVSNTGLGDTLLSTPAIKTLRKSFPNITITLMVNNKFAKLFEEFNYIDNLIIYKNQLINQIINIYKLRALKIDTIFLLHSNGPQDIFFSILSGAQNILKMTYNKNHKFKDLFLNTYASLDQHDILNKIDLIKYFSPNCIDTTMEIGEKFYNTPKIFDDNKIYIGLQVGAANSYKMWDIDNFIDLSHRLIQFKSNIHIILLGNSKLEKKLTEYFMKNTKYSNKILNLCQKTEIQDLPRVINNLNLLITNDTGTMHLAITLKKRTISLFGPTDSKIFGANQDLHLHTVIEHKKEILSNDFNKHNWKNGMDKIPVNEVFLASKKHINNEIQYITTSLR